MIKIENATSNASEPVNHTANYCCLPKETLRHIGFLGCQGTTKREIASKLFNISLVCKEMYNKTKEVFTAAKTEKFNQEIMLGCGWSARAFAYVDSMPKGIHV